MKTELRRFTRPVKASELAEILAGDSTAKSESLNREADFSRVEEKIGEFSQSNERRSHLDAFLVESLHGALVNEIPRRVSLDLRFWQWLAICKFPEIPWMRWHGSVPDDPYTPLETRSLAKRFIGNDSGKVSLAAFSHQAITRLFWCGETLATPGYGYELARACLMRQDLFTAVFERDLCLYPPAARACVAILKDEEEDVHRKSMIRLNHLLTTITVEILSEQEIMELLQGA